MKWIVLSANRICYFVGKHCGWMSVCVCVDLCWQQTASNTLESIIISCACSLGSVRFGSVRIYNIDKGSFVCWWTLHINVTHFLYAIFQANTLDCDNEQQFYTGIDAFFAYFRRSNGVWLCNTNQTSKNYGPEQPTQCALHRLENFVKRIRKSLSNEHNTTHRKSTLKKHFHHIVHIDIAIINRPLAIFQ